MNNKRVIAIISVGLLAVFLVAGVVAGLPGEAKPASLSMQHEARGDVVSPAAPAIDQPGKECPCASEGSALSDTSFSEIDAILADKPVVLFFYADWCHYCHEQMPIIAELEQEYAGRAAFIRINADEKPILKEEFGIARYPAMIIIWGKSDRKYEFEKFEGLAGKEPLEAAIERATSQEDVGYLADSNSPSTKTKFEGTVQLAKLEVGYWHWVVSGLTWTGGLEPCGDPIDVYREIVEWCHGSFDPSITKGDEVEVYGDLPVGGCWVSLCEADSYIKKKTAAADCCPCQVTTDKESYSPDESITITAKFCSPASDSEVVCGLVEATSYSYVEIEGCDGNTYFILWENHPDLWSEVSGYHDSYIRLTGVVIEGYGPYGEPIIGGYDSIEIISDCSDCVSGEYCDPDSFTVLLHKPGETIDITAAFARLSEGVYQATGTAGDPGTRTIEVIVEGCPTKEKEFSVSSCCPCQITTRDPTAELGYPNPAHHTDVIVYFEPQCSDTVCGLVTGCSYPWVHLKGCGIPGIHYYVLADNPEPYNELAGYVWRYVRLTGVVIEGYGILGNPFIGGYDTVEQISSCADCQSERCDPASFTVSLQEPPGEPRDITGDFHRYTEGVYRATVDAGEPGTQTIEVNAPDCPTIERELHLVGSTICGQVNWFLEGASIQGCDELTYYVSTGGYGLHGRLEDYNGKWVLLNSVVFEGYVDANTPYISNCDDILEISGCSECYNDKFIDSCTEISSPGDYILTYDILNSTAQECIRITASDVTFDGNGHNIRAAEIIDGTQYRYAIRVADSGTLSNVIVKNVGAGWNWDTGILFSSVDNGKIENSNASDNDDYGIQVVNCSNCEITDNEVHSNLDGICLMDSDNNTISNNTSQGNYSGIGLFWSSNNTITGNTALLNYLGIDLYQESNNNTISDNTMEMNLHHGLYIESNCSGNTINRNVSCSNNQAGEEGNYFDIYDGDDSLGEENTCNTTYNYDDADTTGCAHWCHDWDRDGHKDDVDCDDTDPTIHDEDLSVSSITLDPASDLRVGDRVEVAAQISNGGSSSVTNVKVSFQVDGEAKDEETMSIGGDLSKLIKFYWAAEYGSHTIKIVVDPDEEFPECNEGNNEKTKQITVAGPIKLVLEELYLSDSGECKEVCGPKVGCYEYCANGDIHVQLKILDTEFGKGMIDGIDVNIGSMGVGKKTLNKELMTVLPRPGDDLKIIVYDDDPLSSGRGESDENNKDDVLISATISDFASLSDGSHKYSGSKGYMKIKKSTLTTDIPSDIYKLSPSVNQPTSDTKNAQIVAVIYEEENGTYIYHPVYRDEDIKGGECNSLYKLYRRQKFKRIEDVEHVDITTKSGAFEELKLEYGGDLPYNAVKSEEYCVDIPKVGKKCIDLADVTCEMEAVDQLHGNFKTYPTDGKLEWVDSALEIHPKVYVATWNHMHSNEARSDISNWSGTYHLSLIDKGSMLVDHLTIDPLAYTISGTTQEGEADSATTYVNSDTNEETFVLTWNNPDSDLGFTLLTPNGVEINPSVSDPNIEYVSGDTYRLYTVQNPIPGNWQMEVLGSNVPSGGEDYTIDIFVTSAPGHEITLSFSTDENDQHTPNSEIVISATLTEGEAPLTDADVSAQITKPDDSVSTIQLYDDGLHNDGEAGDGIYGNSFNDTALEGVYQITVVANGTTSIGEPFARMASDSLLVMGTQDITFSDFYYSPSDPAEGDAITIGAKIRNLGSKSASNLEIEFLVDGDVTDSTIVDLAQNSIEHVTSTWTAIQGNHSLGIRIDPNNEIDESKENNYYAETVNVAKAQPDLAVTNLFYPRLYDGQTAGITALVQNKGNADVNNVKITFSAESTTLSNYIDIPRDSLEFTVFNWTAVSGVHNITVTADPEGGIAELDENNNVLIQPVIVEGELQAWDPMVYDENKNGDIEKMEAIQAVMDYFSGEISKEHAIEVIMLYFR